MTPETKKQVRGTVITLLISTFILVMFLIAINPAIGILLIKIIAAIIAIAFSLIPVAILYLVYKIYKEIKNKQ